MNKTSSGQKPHRGHGGDQDLALPPPPPYSTNQWNKHPSPPHGEEGSMVPSNRMGLPPPPPPPPPDAWNAPRMDTSAESMPADRRRPGASPLSSRSPSCSSSTPVTASTPTPHRRVLKSSETMAGTTTFHIRVTRATRADRWPFLVYRTRFPVQVGLLQRSIEKPLLQGKTLQSDTAAIDACSLQVNDTIRCIDGVKPLSHAHALELFSAAGLSMRLRVQRAVAANSRVETEETFATAKRATDAATNPPPAYEAPSSRKRNPREGEFDTSAPAGVKRDVPGANEERDDEEKGCREVPLKARREGDPRKAAALGLPAPPPKHQQQHRHCHGDGSESEPDVEKDGAEANQNSAPHATSAAEPSEKRPRWEMWATAEEEGEREETKEVKLPLRRSTTGIRSQGTENAAVASTTSSSPLPAPPRPTDSKPHHAPETAAQIHTATEGRAVLSHPRFAIPGSASVWPARTDERSSPSTTTTAAAPEPAPAVMIDSMCPLVTLSRSGSNSGSNGSGSHVVSIPSPGDTATLHAHFPAYGSDSASGSSDNNCSAASAFIIDNETQAGLLAAMQWLHAAPRPAVYDRAGCPFSSSEDAALRSGFNDCLHQCVQDILTAQALALKRGGVGSHSDASASMTATRASGYARVGVEALLSGTVDLVAQAQHARKVGARSDDHEDGDAKRPSGSSRATCKAKVRIWKSDAAFRRLRAALMKRRERFAETHAVLCDVMARQQASRAERRERAAEALILCEKRAAADRTVLREIVQSNRSRLSKVASAGADRGATRN